nr:MAG TPA: hypothetical protein [Caudoviricetes sp.]
MEYIAKQLLHYKNQVDDLINGGYDISFLKSSDDYMEITQTKIMIILNTGDFLNYTFTKKLGYKNTKLINRVLDGFDYIFYDKCFMEHEGDIKGYNDFIEFCGKFEYNSQSSIQMDNLLNTAVYGTEVIHIDEPEKNWEIYNHLESIGLLPILRFLRLYIIDTFEDMARLKLSECVNFYLKEI